MQKRFLAGVLCGVLAVSLCGCKKEKVDYAKEEAVQTDLDATTSDEGKVYTEGIAEALGAESEIRETFTTDDGKQIGIYGDVIVPDVQSLNVYCTTARSIDTEMKKQLVDAFSDDGVIYSAEDDKLPREAIQQYIYECKARIAYIEELNEEETDPEARRQWLAEEQEKLAYYEELSVDAKDDYVPTSYDAWEEGTVVIMHEDIPYYMTADETRVSCYAIDYKPFFKDVPLECVSVSGNVVYDVTRLPENDDERAQLADAAERFSKELGVGLFSVDDYDDIWYGLFTMYQDEDANTLDYAMGYRMHLSRVLDGAKVDASNYSTTMVEMLAEEPESDKMLLYHPLESMDILLDESYQVIGFEYDSPLCMPEVETPQVPLLPYETVKETLLKSLAENPVADGSSWMSSGLMLTYNFEYNYSDLELLYFRMENPEREGEYLLIPVWRLRVSKSSNNPQNACMINAIDGSRINIPGELFDWTEMESEE